MLKNAFITCLLLWVFSTAAAAQTIETVIGPPTSQPIVGSRIVFPIYFHNSGDLPVEVELPVILSCRLSDQQNTELATAERIDPVNISIARVAAKGFIKTMFELDLPVSLSSPVSLAAPDLGGNGIFFVVERSPPSFQEPPQTDRARIPAQDPEKLDLSVFINIYQPYVKNLSFYQPMYFLYGVDPEESKFQISFKYRFFNPDNTLSQNHPWISNIFLGYTQTTFWDLQSSSRPFEDTSYKPEIFFQSLNIDTGLRWLQGFFVQTGFEHESNGNSGDNSRSTNSFYLEPSFIILNEKDVTGFRIAPRFRVFINNSDRTNPGFPEYRGNFELRVTFGIARSVIFDSHVRFADEGNSYQMDLTYPLHRLFRNNLDIYLQVQYANALAESLLNYTERTKALRIGLAIVR